MADVETRVRTFVKFFIPGLLFPEQVVRGVKYRDVSRLHIPNSAFAFNFFDIVYKYATVDGRRVETSSDPINETRYYIGTKLCSKQEFEADTNQNKDQLSAHALENRRTMLATMKNTDFVLKARGKAGFMTIDKRKDVALLLINGKQRLVKHSW